MKADACQVTMLLGFDRQLFAPLFQRPYVWKRDEQWAPLWKDIQLLAERLYLCTNDKEILKIRPHFLGAVVLDQYRVPIGKPDARSIIDGQQRLTTLSIFLVAFRDCLRAEDKYQKKYDKQARKLEKFLFNDDMNEDVDRYKVLPTTIDRKTYMTVMNAGSINNLRNLLDQEKISKDAKVVQAYEYFHGSISSWIEIETDDLKTLARIEALSNALREKIRFVVIDMDEQDDAQAIFETLNARGTALLPSDLIKNFLFRQAQEEEADLDHLYEHHWLDFEKDEAFWRQFVGIGHAKRPRIDLYLQHYLMLETCEEIEVGSIFSKFCDFAEKKKESVEWHLSSLQKYGQHFKTFMIPVAGTREGLFLERLETMQFVTAYPFLLELFNVTEGSKELKKERVRILEVIESFLVRRMVCRLSTRGYNTLFLNLIKHLDGKEYCLANVVEFLLAETAESSRFPEDSEFKAAWLEKPIYEAITRPRLKMILLALDSALHVDKTEPYTLKGGLTVEHFLPQHWQTNWKLDVFVGETPEQFDARKNQRNILLHSMGNLTLLTKSLNPAVSNGRFKAKRTEILKHSAINLNRFLQDLDDWDEEAIIERGKTLFKVASKIWKYPKTSIA
jgi:uncharacterized protein with ParB-like and HNH nuclease domain